VPETIKKHSNKLPFSFEFSSVVHRLGRGGIAGCPDSFIRCGSPGALFRVLWLCGIFCLWLRGANFRWWGQRASWDFLSILSVYRWVGMTTWAFGHCKAITLFNLRVSVFFKTPNGSAQWSDLGRPSLVPTPEVFFISPTTLSRHTNWSRNPTVAAELMGGGAAPLLVDFASGPLFPASIPGALFWVAGLVFRGAIRNLGHRFSNEFSNILFSFFHNHLLMVDFMCH